MIDLIQIAKSAGMNEGELQEWTISIPAFARTAFAEALLDAAQQVVEKSCSVASKTDNLRPTHGSRIAVTREMFRFDEGVFLEMMISKSIRQARHRILTQEESGNLFAEIGVHFPEDDPDAVFLFAIQMGFRVVPGGICLDSNSEVRKISNSA